MRQAWNVTPVKTAAYTARPGELVQVDTTAGVVTITLPNATGPAMKGREIQIFDQGGAAATHNITIAASNSQTFNPTSGNTISTNSQAKTYVSDGANWIVK